MREPASVFTPLPLRARSVLELLDTSLKVYKQYFWVLLGWSALVNILGVFASLVCSGFGSFLFTPIFLGVVACCVAAAVRGQNLTFNQGWQFAQARFGGMLGWFLITMLISIVAIGVLCGVFFGVGFLMAPLISGTSSTMQAVLATIYIGSASVIISIVGVALITWAHMAPLVVCMEENNTEKKVLPRSWDLMQGHWMRATSLMTILSLAGFALLIIIWAAGGLLIGLDSVRQAFEGSFSSSFWIVMAVMMSSYVLVFMLFTPAMLIAIVLFYLDIRIRKDALDLEWTTHATAPDTPITPAYSMATAQGNAPSATGFENLTPVAPPIQPIQTPLTTSPIQPASPVAPLTDDLFDVPDFEAAPAPSPAPEPVTSWQTLLEEPVSLPMNADTAANRATEITCLVCGKQSPPNYLFCMSCGAQLSGAR